MVGLSHVAQDQDHTRCLDELRRSCPQPGTGSSPLQGPGPLALPARLAAATCLSMVPTPGGQPVWLACFSHCIETVPSTCPPGPNLGSCPHHPSPDGLEASYHHPYSSPAGRVVPWGPLCCHPKCPAQLSKQSIQSQTPGNYSSQLSQN